MNTFGTPIELGKRQYSHNKQDRSTKKNELTADVMLLQSLGNVLLKRPAVEYSLQENGPHKWIVQLVLKVIYTKMSI